MILFCVVCLSLIVATVGYVFAQSPTKNESGSTTMTDANVEVYRDQLDELTLERRRHGMTESQYLQEQEEVERRLVSDLRVSSPPVKTARASTSSATVLWFGIVVSLAAILLYLAIGTPTAS